MHYALRIQGHLDPCWQDRFGGLCIEQQETGTTLLSGYLPDQAALHGVLLQIIRLGLTLLSLETSEAPNESGHLSARWFVRGVTKENTWSLAQRADCGEVEKDTQHAVLRLVKGRFITMANEKILMVMMSVTDMAKAKAFYAEQLGWSVTSDYGQGDQHWVTLSLPGGGATLTLSTMHGKMKPGTMTLYLSTSDIEATYNDLKAKGVKVNEIKDDLYGPGSGVKWFNLHDPDENRWLVVQS